MTRQETVPLKPTAGAAPDSVSISLPNAGRSYQNIKAALVDLPEIAASITAKTGWGVDISKVSFEVVTSKELNRRSIEDIAKRTGIPTVVPESFLGRMISDTLLRTFHHGALALYLPSEKAIIINEDRLRGLSKDAVKSQLHHELTHAAQDQAYPEFMSSIAELAGTLKRIVRHGGDLPAEERDRREKIIGDKVHARMSLIEGQAVVLQRMYEKEFGLHPEIKIGAIEVALSLASVLVPGGLRKILQYIQGERTFAKIHALGVESVNELFRDPKYTDLVFGSENPKRAAAA